MISWVQSVAARLRGPRPSNEAQLRPTLMINDLLRPGIYQASAKRGMAFTADEEAAVIDACVAAGGLMRDDLGNYPGIIAAKRVLDELTRLPLTLHLRQRQLGALRSVSLAYKLTAMPVHFRFKNLERYVR